MISSHTPFLMDVQINPIYRYGNLKGSHTRTNVKCLNAYKMRNMYTKEEHRLKSPLIGQMPTVPGMTGNVRE